MNHTSRATPRTTDPSAECLTRRAFVSGLGVGLLAAAAPPLAFAGTKRRRVLCFTKSAGFEHSVVKRGPNGEPALVERTLTALGARHGFDVECTKDGSVFTRDRLRAFDAAFFFTTGDLETVGLDGQPPMPAGGKQVLLDAVRGGMGFVGGHSATDTFLTQPDPADGSNRYVSHGAAADPYIRMIGGEFIGHAKQQVGRVRIVDARFPGMSAFGSAGVVKRMGEWYSLKDFAPDLHVLAVLETDGMVGPHYLRGPYPIVWARRHGRGRVYSTALGHREEEWAEDALPGSLVGALRWAFGDVRANVAPDLSMAAPRASDMPPRES